MDLLNLPPSHAVSSRRPLPRWIPVLAIVLLAHGLLLLAWVFRGCRQPPARGESVAPRTATNAVAVLRRELPATFPVNTYLPALREIEASGGIDLTTFSPGRDLAYFADTRVWWESDNDGTTDDECDHTMHHALVEPLKRVVEQVTAQGALLEVQDCYRSSGIHNPKSLHREGRAIDLTCEGLPMEMLAKFCWQAGFDWVYHEGSKRNNGAHVHASVRRGGNNPPPAVAPPQGNGARGPSRQTESVD